MESDHRMVWEVNAATQRTILLLIGAYRRWISHLLPPACRFHPTCSDYAAESIRVHGPWRGTALAVKRVCRCHPLSAGGFDPVPPKSGVRSDTPSVPAGVPAKAVPKGVR